MVSVIAVALIYLTMNVAILGVVPWREVIHSKHIASDLMLQVYGNWAAGLTTALIIWTALASTYAALLSYSRIPYASAKAGHFFKAFAQTHPTGHFPHRSLLLMGALAAIGCLADLQTVISAMLASRILIQFVGQIATVLHLRANSASPSRIYRMPLYPLPALVALTGWLFTFSTSGLTAIGYGVGSLVIGVVAFVVWDRATAASELPTQSS
jgi:amino acid transporter